MPVRSIGAARAGHTPFELEMGPSLLMHWGTRHPGTPPCPCWPSFLPWPKTSCPSRPQHRPETAAPYQAPRQEAASVRPVTGKKPSLGFKTPYANLSALDTLSIVALNH